MITSDKNLLYFCYVGKLCPEILDCLKEIGPRYNLEIEQHDISQPCIPKSGEFNKKFVIFYSFKQDDIKLLQEDYEKYKNLFKNITIILCCPFGCDIYKEKVNAQYCIDSSDISNLKKTFSSILETCLEKKKTTANSNSPKNSEIHSHKRYIK